MRKVAAVHGGGGIEVQQGKRRVAYAAADFEKDPPWERGYQRVRDGVSRRWADLDGFLIVGFDALDVACLLERIDVGVGVVRVGAVVVYIITRGGGGEDSGPLPPEVVPVLEEPVAVVLVEDVPVLPRVALVLLDPKLVRS